MLSGPTTTPNRKLRPSVNGLLSIEARGSIWLDQSVFTLSVISCLALDRVVVTKGLAAAKFKLQLSQLLSVFRVFTFCPVLRVS